jgi:hypothetical protein
MRSRISFICHADRGVESVASEYIKPLVRRIAEENNLDFSDLPLDDSFLREYSVLETIKHSCIVIMDLSHRTDVALFAHGFLLALQKAVIFIEDDKRQRPFDVMELASITFPADPSRLLNREVKIYYELSNTIRLVLKDPTEFNLEGIRTKPMRVFVSYARADRDLLDRIRPFFKTLEHQNISIFIDESIEHGAAWKDRLDQELTNCHCALLLLTSALFSSVFVRDVELPTIIKRHAAGELSIYPVVGMAPGDDKSYHSFLAQYQTINSPNLPIYNATDLQVQSVALDLIARLAKERARLKKIGHI